MYYVIFRNWFVHYPKQTVKDSNKWHSASEVLYTLEDVLRDEIQIVIKPKQELKKFIKITYIYNEYNLGSKTQD